MPKTTMSDDELVGRMTAALSQRSLLLAYVTKLEAVGEQLSKAAYELKQLDRLSRDSRARLSSLQIAWDEVTRMRPLFLKEKP